MPVRYSFLRRHRVRIVSYSQMSSTFSEDVRCVFHVCDGVISPRWILVSTSFRCWRRNPKCRLMNLEQWKLDVNLHRISVWQWLGKMIMWSMELVPGGSTRYYEKYKTKWKFPASHWPNFRPLQVKIWENHFQKMAKNNHWAEDWTLLIVLVVSTTSSR